MSLARRIASSTISQVVAKFFIAGLSIVSVKLVTNYLGASGYGEYTVIYELMAFALIMADFGFFHIALREMGKNRNKMAKILANIMSLRLIISLIAITLTTSVVFFGTNYPLETVKIGLMIASANVVFGLMGTTITAILQVHLKMTYAALIQIIGKIFMVSYIAIAVWNDLGFLHTLWAGLFGSILILGLTFIYARRYSKITFGFDLDLWKDLFKQTYPMGIALIFYNIYLRSPILILDRMTLNSSLTGIYGVSQRIIEIIMFIPIAFMNSILPTLSDLLHNPLNTQVKEKINKLIQTCFDLLTAIVLPIIVGTVIIAPKIINLISGKDFMESALILKWLVFMLFFYFLNTLFIYLLIALNKQKHVAITNFIAAVSSVTVSLTLIPIFGVYGAVAGHIVPEFVALVIAFYYSKKFYTFSINLWPSIRVLMASLFMGILVYQLAYLNIFVVIFLASIFYIIGLTIFQALPFTTIYLATFGKLTLKNGNSISAKKIAVDFRSIYGQKTGKEWYTFSILESLGKIDKNNHYVLYSKYDFDDSDLPDNFTKRVLKTPIIVWHIHVLFDMIFNKIDVVLATSSYIIACISRFSRRFKVILVVHDLVAFLFPAKKHSLKATIIERLTASMAFHRADQIIVPSKNTFQDLAREFPKTKNKTTIIPEAGRESFRPIDDSKATNKVLEKYNLPKNYMIFIGTLEPRKNLVRLLKAYTKIDKKIQEEFPLIIVGKKGWYYERIFNTVKEESLEDRVIFTGYVPDEDLHYLLSNAKLSIYPSKYEGFGLPLLEAMQCKTPIVSSNTPALLEVAEGVCEIADRKDIDSIKNAILNVITNEDRQKELIKKGYERSKKYSWTKAAKEILDIIKNFNF